MANSRHLLAAGPRYERDLSEFGLERRQQLLRHPCSAEKPSALRAVLDLQPRLPCHHDLESRRATEPDQLPGLTSGGETTLGINRSCLPPAAAAAASERRLPGSAPTAHRDLAAGHDRLRADPVVDLCTVSTCSSRATAGFAWMRVPLPASSTTQVPTNIPTSPT